MKNLFALCVLILNCAFVCHSQCFLNDNDKKYIYKKVVKNYIMYNAYHEFVRNDHSYKKFLDNGGEFVLDSSEWYAIHFRCLNQDTMFMDFRLVEFTVDLSTIYGGRHFSDEYIRGTGFSYSKVKSIGLIGVDKSKDRYPIISGNLFLDTLTTTFFSEYGINDSTLSTYAKIRYYNYSPQILKIGKNYVLFESTFTETQKHLNVTYVKKYKLKIKRHKNRRVFNEKLIELNSKIIDSSKVIDRW